jgi:predicted lipoprotein with Yx(FWY)xxD motif
LRPSHYYTNRTFLIFFILTSLFEEEYDLIKTKSDKGDTTMRNFNSFFKLLMTIAASTLLFASISAAATLTVKSKDGIGTYLADDKGMALYLFKKDAPNKSVCGAANSCLEKWPVFFADSVDPNAGIDSTDVGTITRDDGLKQTTFKGQPLYYFFKDKDGEDVYGQGVNNVWYVVAP